MILFRFLYKYIFPYIFEREYLLRIDEDVKRRFAKPVLNDYNAQEKIKYIRVNIQYLTLIYFRLATACKIPLLKRFLVATYQRLSMKTGIEFLTPNIGGGVIMPHWGRIILNAKKIGDNLYVLHNVTVGNDYVSGVPTIGNNVFIGTNSVILGDITIGDNVVIGACSFVNTNIPSNSLVAGNPARVIRTIESDYISRMIGY